MNTKSMPAVLALVAGFATCIISFVQRVDNVVFAKRFVVACIVFFSIGTIAAVIINMNFKEMDSDATEEQEQAQAVEGDDPKEEQEQEQEKEADVSETKETVETNE